MSENGLQSPEEQIRALYQHAEASAAETMNTLVGKPSFGQVLAMGAENIAALVRMGSDAADALLRNLRVAGRADVVRLSRQLHRTDDKLERVLQEVEELREELARAREVASS